MFEWRDWSNTPMYEYTNGMDCISEVRFDIFEIICDPGRKYKDGTYQYLVYLGIRVTDSKKKIILCKVRGHLADAKAKVEELFWWNTGVEGKFKKEGKEKYV